DGHGGFDDVSGAVGLDLDQDGRSFAVFDYDGDGDPDVAVMAARSTPQLRLFRNDFKDRGASVAVRLVGRISNRDAVGARVSVQTDALRRTKIVQAGSGFLSQHSKELLFGLGASRRVVEMTVEWPSGRKQVFSDVPLNHRLVIEEGGQPRAELPRGRAAASGIPTGPVVVASEEVGLSYAILNRHLFMNRQDLRLPTAYLLDAEGSVVKVYRDRVEVSEILRDVGRIDATPAERLARALPFEGTLYSPAGRRNYLPYGRELLDQGLEAPAIVAFERAAQASASASTPYQLGTLLVKSRQPAKARAAFERALEVRPDLSEASNHLGTILATGGDLPGAIEKFRAALATTPDYPDALNNLGYALILTGRPAEARGLYERALALQPDFPEALNNLGLILGREGDLERAGSYFREALDKRPDYGEAANNLALVLVARVQTGDAIRLLEGFLERHPEFENTYITLAKIYLRVQRVEDGRSVLERLLRRNPAHREAREILQHTQQ